MNIIIHTLSKSCGILENKIYHEQEKIMWNFRKQLFLQRVNSNMQNSYNNINHNYIQKKFIFLIIFYSNNNNNNNCLQKLLN